MSELLDFKCPNCGSALRFDSESQTVKCPYCDTEINVDAFKDEDESLKADSLDWEVPNAGQAWEDEEKEHIRVFTCESCGGEIVCDENTVATKCPYCDNNVVLRGNLMGYLKPDFVIPFKLDKEQAKEGYLRHLEKKKFLPDVFKDKNHIDEIKGVYVPFWLYECNVDADVKYTATKVSSWADKNNIYTRTAYYRVLRSGSISFDNVPVDGSSSMADELMQSIEPYDFREAVDFKTAYLAGYLADKYDVNSEQAVPVANSRIKLSTEEAFRNTVGGYASVSPEGSSVRLENGTARYALYPVWILNTTYEGRKYTFAMNGQTGKFVGNLPLDKKKYRNNTLMVGAIASVLVFAIEMIALLV